MARSPRINIAVTPGTKEVLDRIAAATETSVSKVAGDIIEEAFPQLALVANAIEKAKSNPGASMVDLQLALIQAQRGALDVQSSLIQPSDKSNS